MNNETECRLRKAREHLEECRRKENDARKALAEAINDTKRAKEKHEEKFFENEKAEIAKRLKGY